MKAFLQIFAIFFIAISSASRTKRQILFEDDNRLNSECRTPDRRPGRCIPLTSCGTIPQRIRGYRLRRYLCGFRGDESSVCCPLARGEIPAADTTGRTTLRTFPTTVTTTRQPRDMPGTTQSTRTDALNAQTRPSFLPSSCGALTFMMTRIVGGTRADKGSWPWMAVVLVRRNGVLVPDCGGALVTNSHVITAAHCVVTRRRSLDPSRVVVRLGAYNMSIPNEPDSIDVGVEWIRPHEQFQSRTYRNDIAVLKLSSPVTFTENISPVCLPYDSLRGEDLTNSYVAVIGYGNLAYNGRSSDVLMQAVFPVLPQEACRRAYEPEVQFSDVYLCAGMMDGSRDACQGDSGGPLVAIGRNNNFYLVGIVSFGSQCGQANFPGVYTRVTEFLDWLTRNLSD